MNEGELRSLLPAVRRLTADRRSELEEELMDAIDREVGSTGSTESTEGATVRRRKRRWRRRAIGGAVGVAAALGATAAAAAVMQSDRPDPQQAARVNEANEDRASVHLPGWRVPLDAEQVACVFASEEPPEAPFFPTTSASEFPLEEPLTEEHLVEECVNGTDYGRVMYEGAGDAMTCIREGSVPRPVVMVDIESCADGLVPVTEDHLAEINRLRSIEVAVMAVLADEETCPTFGEARDWVVARLEEFDEDLPVHGEDRGEGCYHPSVSWPLDVNWPDGPDPHFEDFERRVYIGLVAEENDIPSSLEEWEAVTPPTTDEG